MADEPILVGTPDGQRFQFPAGTDRLTMKRAIDEHYRSTAVGQGGAPSLPPDPPPEPSLGRQAWDAVNTGVNWLGTQAVNALANTVDMAPDTAGPAAAARAATGKQASSAPASGGDIIKGAVFNTLGAPEVNAPGTAGKVLDAATQAVMGASAFPGRMAVKWLPAAVGGASSEFAGQQAAGTPYEIPARFAGGVVGGTAAAAGQEAVRAGARGVRNVLALKGDVEDTTARAAARNLQRDGDTPQALLDRTNALGPGAALVDAAGENIRGSVRGAIVPQGPARATFDKNIGERAKGEVDRLGDSVNKNISPKGLVQTVDDIVEARGKASGPAYEASGVPRDPKDFAKAPVLQSPAVKALIADSADIQDAIKAVRRLPAYKDLPDTSMVMLDEAYKRLGDMSRGARDQFGKATHGSRQIDDLRVSFAAAIGEENPNYSAALKAFSEPSRLKDAAELAAKLFSGNKPAELVRREYAKLPDDAKEAFRVGAAERYRQTLDSSDATNAASRIAKGQGGRDRLTAILSKEEVDAILGDVAREKAFTKTARMRGGSDSVPKGLEAADNAELAGGVAGDVLRGRFTNALARVSGRITEGQTERTNARLTEFLTSLKPEDQAAFVNMLEQSVMRQRLAAPRNAFRAGAAAPVTTSTNERR